MKPFYAVLSAIIISQVAHAQLELGGSYSMSLPMCDMGKNIQPLHSLSTSINYRMPGKFNRISVGAEFGIGFYAYVTKEQDLRFPDGSGIRTNVTYSSNVASAALQTKINILDPKKAKVNPYFLAKGGYACFFSNVLVEDPEDGSSCRPLDHENIISDNTMWLAYGGGVQIDLSAICKKEKQGKVIFDFAVSKISGGELDYINTKHIKDHIHTDPTAPQPSPGPVKSEPLTVRFVNVSTQTIHEHQVAEVYNSPLEMLDLRLGVLFRLGK